MQKFVPVLLLLVLIAVSGVGYSQISNLKAQIAQQRNEINRLSTFVNAQADALNSCQKVVSDLADSVIHDNWFEMFGSVGDLTTQMGLCNGSIEAFNQIAAENSP